MLKCAHLCSKHVFGAMSRVCARFGTVAFFLHTCFHLFSFRVDITAQAEASAVQGTPGPAWVTRDRLIDQSQSSDSASPRCVLCCFVIGEGSTHLSIALIDPLSPCSWAPLGSVAWSWGFAQHEHYDMLIHEWSRSSSCGHTCHTPRLFKWLLIWSEVGIPVGAVSAQKGSELGGADFFCGQPSSSKLFWSCSY